MITFICSLDLEQSDQEFMVELYQEFKSLMYFTVKKYVSTPEIVEDLLQDSIVKLIEKVGTLRSMDQYAMAGYIAATVRNTSINYLKKQSILSDGQSNRSEGRAAADVEPATVDELILIKERIGQLAKIWPKLPEDDQCLLEGKYILGYTDAELAQQLGCKTSSIRMKLTRARRTAFSLLIQLEGGVFCDET